MGIGIVSAGAVATDVSGTATPSFGTPTTAGNLIVLVFGIGGGGSLFGSPGTPTGYTAAGSPTSANAIYYKENCAASETAPTLSYTGGGSQQFSFGCQLIEISGVLTSSSLDQATVNPNFVSNDALPGSLAVFSSFFQSTKSATWTFTDSWSPVGGVVGSTAGSVTKASSAFWFSLYITSTNASPTGDTVTATPSTGAINASDFALATFKPVSAAASIVYDDRRVRRNVLLRL